MNKGEISAVVKVWSRLSGFEDHLCSLEAACPGQAAWPFCTCKVEGNVATASDSCKGRGADGQSLSGGVG